MATILQWADTMKNFGIALGLMVSVLCGCSGNGTAEEEVGEDEGAMVDGTPARQTFRTPPSSGADAVWLAGLTDAQGYAAPNVNLLAVVDGRKEGTLSFVVRQSVGGGHAVMTYAYQPELGAIASLDPLRVRDGHATIAGSRLGGTRFSMTFDLQATAQTLPVAVDGREALLPSASTAELLDLGRDVTTVLSYRGQGSSLGVRVFGVEDSESKRALRPHVAITRGEAPTRVYSPFGMPFKTLDRLEVDERAGNIAVRGVGSTGKPLVYRIKLTEGREVEYWSE